MSCISSSSCRYSSDTVYARLNRLDTRISYFIGNDPAGWHTDVPAWGGVCYVDLYPGIDLEVTSENGCWVWQLVCRANCQPFGGVYPEQGRRAQDKLALQDVRLCVEGVDALALDGDVLCLTTALGEYILPLLQVVGAADANLASPTITGDQVALPFASAISNPKSAICNRLTYSTAPSWGGATIGTGAMPSPWTGWAAPT